MQAAPSPRKGAFTLLEILVVLAIIAILSALLFPAFSRARENGRQSSCASNLQQLYLATQQYYQDERAYPDSIVDLLPPGSDYDRNGTADKIPDSAVGYFKAGKASLLCPNDTTDQYASSTAGYLPGARSSYGALTKYISANVGSLSLPYSDPAPTTMADLGRYAWNYWGYTTGGYAYANGVDASTNADLGINGTKATRLTTPDASVFATTTPPIAVNGSNIPVLNAEGAATYQTSKRDNVITYSLSNRFAPPTTIITHCVFHRPNTDSGNIQYPGQLYSTSVDGKGARDMVLRLDGTVKAVDVSQWFGNNSTVIGNTTNYWINQSLTQ